MWRVNTEEICYKSQDICVTHDRSVDVVRMVNLELEVAEVEDGGDELACLRNVPLDRPMVLRATLSCSKWCASSSLTLFGRVPVLHWLRYLYCTFSVNVDAASPPVMHL